MAFILLYNYVDSFLQDTNVIHLKTVAYVQSYYNNNNHILHPEHLKVQEMDRWNISGALENIQGLKTISFLKNLTGQIYCKHNIKPKRVCFSAND